MTSQVVPIENLAATGLALDTPAVSLPPNAFTMLENVRISAGALRKREGEQQIFMNATINNIQYVAWWPNVNLAPNDGYYIIVNRTLTMDQVYIVKASEVGSAPRLLKSLAHSEQWQHAIFSGGYAFVINNGIDKPQYILDTTNGTDPTSLVLNDLPGWDSYLSSEPVVDELYDTDVFGTSYDFNLGTVVNFTNYDVIVSVIGANGISKLSGTYTSASTTIANTTLNVESDTNSNTITFASNFVVTDDTVRIYIRSKSAVNVRAGVIRTFGDTLVAGNLTEYMGSTQIRNLPGVVRISDVAPAGSIPSNWNPYFTGAGTADEFVLSSTGIVQDMVELQGALIVYTNKSIHSIQPTSNPSVPYATKPITNNYGALGTNSVLEFDGKHVVVGSDDIYIFSGHPGNIQSVADDRVRFNFYNTLHIDDRHMFLIRNPAYDEIWLCYPDTTATGTAAPFANVALVWNYRDNTWVTRRISEMRPGDLIPTRREIEGGSVTARNPSYIRPMFATADRIYAADADSRYMDVAGLGYETTIERKMMAMSPEFDTESLSGMALWTEGGATTTELLVRTVPANNPGETVDFSGATPEYKFNTTSDYKIDVRVNGRFLNYQIRDNSAQASWNISGMQLELRKGGRR